MKCPFCDLLLNIDDLFSHIDTHKSTNNMVNDNTPKINSAYINYINKKKIFEKERIENLVIKKIDNIEQITDLIPKRNFIEQIKIILSKFPLLYMPYFINDYFHGVNSSEIIQKYHIRGQTNLQIIGENILKLNGSRYRSTSYNNAFDMNIGNQEWYHIYHSILQNCKFFNDEINYILFYNIMRAYMILMMFDHTEKYVEIEFMTNKFKNIVKNYDLVKFIDQNLINSFDIFIETDLKNIVNEIIDELQFDGLIKKIDEQIIGLVSIDDLKQIIIDNLKMTSGPSSIGMMKYVIMLNHPYFTLIQDVKLWDMVFDDLQHNKIIHIVRKSNSNALIFLNEDYENMIQKLSNSNMAVHIYGRTISPDNFIKELKMLAPGDFGDVDDQITRIAGLMLSESIKMNVSNIPQLDFSIDLKNYNFRDEQYQMMKNINLKIISNTLHCKIMLDECLTVDKYNELKKILPINEQCIIFTFINISDQIKDILKHDQTIQIVDELGIKTWISHTPIIPSRKESIVKIHYDPMSKLKKIIAFVQQLDYENGFAVVNTIPNISKHTVLITSLEEMDVLKINNADEFGKYSKRYYDFLTLLSKMSDQNEFTIGLFDVEPSNIMIKNSKISMMFGAEKCDISSIKNFDEKFSCTCMRFADDPSNMCRHIISGLNTIMIKNEYYVNDFKSGNLLYDAMINFMIQSTINIYDDILFNLDEKIRPDLQKYLIHLFNNQNNSD